MNTDLTLLHAGYVVVLVWFLVRKGPSPHALPDMEPVVFSRWRFGPWVQALFIGLVFVLVATFDGGTSILYQLMMVATIWVLVAWRRKIRFPWVAQGLALGSLALLAGIPMMKNGLISVQVYFIFPLFVPPMYVAGGLLVDRTHLGGIQLQARGPRKAFSSFLWGCLLFLPLGLINAVDGASSGMSSGWVTDWWMPLVLPWFSGITEEAWFRLLLMGLCFFLLRPAFRSRPELAVVATVLFSGITFGLAHGRNVQRLLITGFLYGVPMATVFARRDWEHAVGAHYMINMPTTLAVYLDI